MLSGRKVDQVAQQAFQLGPREDDGETGFGRDPGGEPGVDVEGFAEQHDDPAQAIPIQVLPPGGVELGVSGDLRHAPRQNPGGVEACITAARSCPGHVDRVPDHAIIISERKTNLGQRREMAGKQGTKDSYVAVGELDRLTLVGHSLFQGVLRLLGLADLRE